MSLKNSFGVVQIFVGLSNFVYTLNSCYRGMKFVERPPSIQ